MLLLRARRISTAGETRTTVLYVLFTLASYIVTVTYQLWESLFIKQTW